MPEIKKYALVTGASRGIGRAIAQRLAIDGYQVVVHYNANEQAAHETANGMPGHHFKIRADLSDPIGVDELVAATQSQIGSSLDVLVHNAGIYEPTPIVGSERLDSAQWVDRWRRQMQVNFLAGVQLTYSLMPLLQSAQSGRVIQIGSRAGHRGEAGFSAYAASKAAQANFVKSMALELAPHGVYSFGIAPGWTETDMSAATFAEKRDEIQAGIPYGRAATPEEISSLVAYLCTETANYLTGNIIDVNGASYLR